MITCDSTSCFFFLTFLISICLYVRLYYFCVLLFIYNAARLLWIECTIEVIP